MKEMKLIEYFLNNNHFLNTICLLILGGPPPPNCDPMFELKKLPGTLKYAYLDEKNIYPVILVLTFQNMKKKDC